MNPESEPRVYAFDLSAGLGGPKPGRNTLCWHQLYGSNPVAQIILKQKFPSYHKPQASVVD